MPLRRNMETEEARRFWQHAEKVHEEVQAWPEHKRNDDNPMRRQLEEASKELERRKNDSLLQSNTEKDKPYNLMTSDLIKDHGLEDDKENLNEGQIASAEMAESMIWGFTRDRKAYEVYVDYPNMVMFLIKSKAGFARVFIDQQGHHYAVYGESGIRIKKWDDYFDFFALIKENSSAE